MKIFLAGAGGAIGRRLTPLLRSAGHAVFGTTRAADKAGALRALGAEPVVVDVFDAQALARAVHAAAPDVVLHQLTDLAFAPQHVCLAVADHGRGIAAEEQAKIFERFYRVGSELRRETAGVGLGLAIVKHITEAHGGTTRVEGSVGHGSRFIVELPLTEIREERAVSADAAV